MKSDSSDSSLCPFFPAPVLHRLDLNFSKPVFASVSGSCSETESASEELREAWRSAKEGRDGAGAVSVGHAKPNLPE